jgi:hypothetical protein
VAVSKDRQQYRFVIPGTRSAEALPFIVMPAILPPPNKATTAGLSTVTTHREHLRQSPRGWERQPGDLPGTAVKFNNS